MGCTFAGICPTGKETGFPSLGICKKRKRGCEESRFMFRGKRMGSLLYAGSKGWYRSRHGQASVCLEMLRRQLTERILSDEESLLAEQVSN